MSSDNPAGYYKQFFKKNFAYTIAHLFERSVIFLLLPFYTKVLSPTDYGIYSILFANISILTFIYTFGIENGLIKFSAEVDNPVELNSTIFISVISPAVLFTILFGLFAHSFSIFLFNTEQYFYLVIITGLILFSDNINRFYLYSYIGQQKAKMFTLVSILKGVLTILLNIYLVGILGWGIDGIFYAYLITSVLIIFVYLFFAPQKIELKFNSKLYLRLLKYGFPLMINSMIFMLLNFVDQYIMQFKLGSDSVGKYSAVYKFGLGINVIATSYIVVAIPFGMKLFRENVNAERIMNAIKNISVLLLSLVVIGISLFIKEIVAFDFFIGYEIIDPRYNAPVEIVPLLMASYLLMILYHTYSLPVYYKEKTYLLTLITGCALLANIIANLILIPVFSFWGAAFATFISIFVLAAGGYIISSKLQVIKFRLTFSVVILIMTVVILIANQLIQLSILSRIILLSAITFATGFYLKSKMMRLLKNE